MRPGAFALGALAAGIALAAPPIAHAEAATGPAEQRYVAGEAIVRFEAGVGAAGRREARSGADVGFDESLRLPRIQVVEFDGSVRSALERLEDQPGVAYAQPNYRYRAFSHITSDAHSDALWGIGALPGVDVAPAWARTRGAGQVIGILDTGVDLTHPDLAGNLWSGPGGVRGHDFVHNDSDPSDHQYHGTHVAGSAAAVAGNGIGVAGVAPEADIMAVRVLDGDGGGSTSEIINGIGYASTNGARVINMSLGGPAGASDTAMSNAIAAAEQRGSTIVAAAGNFGLNNDLTPFSPCNLPNPNVICVAAIDDQQELASYSNHGAGSVDVGAPGGDFEAGENEIASAKPAYGAPLAPIEDFEDISDWTSTSNNATLWGTVGSAGSRFVADSPAGTYPANTQSQLLRNGSISLAGQQGCRVHFDGRLKIETDFDVDGNPVDHLDVGAAAGAAFDEVEFFESTFGGGFQQLEASISDLDGQAVQPRLQFTSDSTIQFDGADIDNLKVLCRNSAYNGLLLTDANEFELPASEGGGDYMSISGTSMATPHVAGVAALVLSADPGASPAQVVQAIRNGVRALPSLSGKTVSGGAVNANGAIDASLAIPNPQPVAPTATPTPTTTAAPTPPARARFGRVSVSRRGIVSMVLRGDRNTTGVATLRANITAPRAARLMRVARKAFRIGSTGRTTVKLRLTRRALSQLRRTRRLALRARVVLTNTAGLKSTATARLRIALRRR